MTPRVIASLVFSSILLGTVALTARNQQPDPSSGFVRVYSEGTPGLTAPVNVREVKLTYPAEAMRAKVQGTVGLSITVNADGTVRDAMVTKSVDATTGLDDAAVEAASKWVYQPGKLDGKPVPVRLEISLGAKLH